MIPQQLQATGAVLSACVDMAKGHVGDQYGVTIVCRHKTGPFHLMLGDDDELGVMSAASTLLRQGKHLIKDGVPADRMDEPTLADQMVTLLRDCEDVFSRYADSHQAKAAEITTMGHSAERDDRLDKAAANRDMADRIKVLLAKVDGEVANVDPALAPVEDETK
jgi:hypothetical protein